MLIGVTRATQHLNSKVVGFRPVFRRPGLYYWRQEVEQLEGSCPPNLIGMGLPVIDQLRSEQTQAPRTLCVCFLGE